MKHPELIGVAGTLAAGKDTVSDMLTNEYGFYHVSTSDIIRIEAMKRYGNIERETLRFAGNELRQQFGADILCILAIEQAAQAAPGHPATISGIRALGEAATIKDRNGLMLFVDAPITTRYERLAARGRIDDSVSLESFIESEQKELSNSDSSSQNIEGVRAMSDVVIQNDGDIDAFKAAVHDLLG